MTKLLYVFDLLHNVFGLIYINEMFSLFNVFDNFL